MSEVLALLKRFRVAIIAVVLVFLVIGAFGKANSIQKTGVDKETALSAQYLDNQNELSAFILGFYEKVSVADRKSDKLEAILVDAVKGRYEGETSAQPGTGMLFSAISEAYPDLTASLDVYDQVLDHISAGREAYKQKQSKLLDMLRSYDRWRRSGIVHSRLVSVMGLPGGDLKARIGTRFTTGSSALDQMYLIVLTEDARDAYETGTLTPLEVPEEGTK